VLLKNSQTAVIGGIYQNDMTEGQNKVPGLANIPLIGWLFKNKSVDQRRTELLIFLTPKILGQQGSLSQMVTNPSLSPSAPAPVEEDISAALDGTEANGDSSLSDSAQQDGGNKQESSGDDEFGLEEQSEDF
jgi:type II secretory pathway component GspD/PulD (secretin)